MSPKMRTFTKEEVLFRFKFNLTDPGMQVRAKDRWMHGQNDSRRKRKEIHAEGSLQEFWASSSTVSLSNDTT